MSRKKDRVSVILHPQAGAELSAYEIRAILRGADSLIMRGGRNMLTKLLKGSKDKKLLELGLDKNPSYSAFSHLGADEAAAKIDWCIKHDYLAIEYDGRLPLLVFTQEGWEIVKHLLAGEKMEMLRDCAQSGDYSGTDGLKDYNRQVIMELLERIAQDGDKSLIPVLEHWKGFEYKKVRAAIERTVRALTDGSRFTS